MKRMKDKKTIEFTCTKCGEKFVSDEWENMYRSDDIGYLNPKPTDTCPECGGKGKII